RVELERREELLEQSRCYKQAAGVRKLVADFRSASANLPTFWSDETRGRWTSWAERIADRLNPFRNSYFSEKLAQTDFEPELDCRQTNYLGVPNTLASRNPRRGGNCVYCA